MSRINIKTVVALSALALAAGCAPTTGGGYGPAGAPFAPYSTASSGLQDPFGTAPQRQGPGIFSKRNLGALGGAAAGGLAGAQFGSGSGQLAMTALGVVSGLLLGGSVGTSLDKADEAYAYMELQRALSANQQVIWQGQQAAGRITPIRTVPKKKKSDQTCREFRHEVLIGSETKEGVGRACLQRDGSWKLQNG